MSFSILKKVAPINKKKSYNPEIAGMVKRVEKSKMYGYSRPAYMTTVRSQILSASLGKGATTDWSIFIAMI